MIVLACPQCLSALRFVVPEVQVGCDRCGYRAALVYDGPNDPLPNFVERASCAICTEGVVGLVRAADGRLECARCRDEHPRAGGYSFDEQGARSTVGTGRSAAKNGAP